MSDARYSTVDRPDYRGLVVVAWFLAFLMPLIGFILGIILNAKNVIGHGVGIMVVSLVWSLFLLLLFMI